MSVLRPPAGEVPVRFDADLTWIAGDPEHGPAWELRELASPAEVDALDGPPEDAGEIALWAWADRDAGRIRQRVFAHEIAIVEDEATGSAAMQLVAELGRELRSARARAQSSTRGCEASCRRSAAGSQLEEVREHG